MSRQPCRAFALKLEGGQFDCLLYFYNLFLKKIVKNLTKGCVRLYIADIFSNTLFNNQNSKQMSFKQIQNYFSYVCIEKTTAGKILANGVENVGITAMYNPNLDKFC